VAFIDVLEQMTKEKPEHNDREWNTQNPSDSVTHCVSPQPSVLCESSTALKHLSATGVFYHHVVLLM
jgi:hypothetical protein